MTVENGHAKRGGSAKARTALRRALEAHLTQLGYTSARIARPTRLLDPEIVRINPGRGRLAYGETVLRSDIEDPACHERLLNFSQRRTRQRSSILFFIGVAVEDQADLEGLLERLSIRGGIRGGHVHIVPIAPPEPARRRALRASRTAASTDKAEGR